MNLYFTCSTLSTTLCLDVAAFSSHKLLARINCAQCPCRNNSNRPQHPWNHCEQLPPSRLCCNIFTGQHLLQINAFRNGPRRNLGTVFIQRSECLPQTISTSSSLLMSTSFVLHKPLHVSSSNGTSSWRSGTSPTPLTVAAHHGHLIPTLGTCFQSTLLCGPALNEECREREERTQPSTAPQHGLPRWPPRLERRPTWEHFWQRLCDRSHMSTWDLSSSVSLSTCVANLGCVFLCTNLLRHLLPLNGCSSADCVVTVSYPAAGVW